VGYDHRWDLRQVLRAPRLNHGFIQGNFDQSLLFLPADQFEERATRYLSKLKALTENERKGWVSGLGHGVLPGTPEANVRRFVQLVREIFV
jgi:uroporphyrinogen decarboxylase